MQPRTRPTTLSPAPKQMAEIRRFAPKTKTLGQIARYLGVEISAELSNIEITGVTSSSNRIEDGELFIALPGAKTHGGAFLQSAVERGARAVLTDNAGVVHFPEQKSAIPVLVVPNPRSQSGFLADWFFDSPSQSLFVAGITGTNGKTTTTYLLHQIWQRADIPTGLIGTVGIRIGEEFFPATHTTPEADSLHSILSVMQERHIRGVAMEVSSHALVQNRVAGVKFSAVGFTNLSQDHLDFHGTMENYFNAKKSLFDSRYSDHAYVNIDNEFGARLANENTISTSTLSKTNKKATWYFEKLELENSGYRVAIRGEGGILIEGLIPLIGEYNLDNALLAVAIAVQSGVDPLVIGNSLVDLVGAPGRLEKVDLGQNFSAVVDYAHTPDAVEKVLLTLRASKKSFTDEQLTDGSKLIGVLGCGGDRDNSKRPLMGRALSAGTDVAIFTSDNPRSENPNDILKQMTEGCALREFDRIIEDRAAAIEYAVSIAGPGDVVVVLGKGHETGQEIQGVIHPFSDQIELRRLIEARG